MRHHQGLRKNLTMTSDQNAGMSSITQRSVVCVVLWITLTQILCAEQPPSIGRFHHSAATSSPLVKDVAFHSPALNREMKYRIYLPHTYAGSSRRYPVLYLLHGLYGNYENWDTLTQLATYVSGVDWIIVMPDADDSWYTNSATVPQDKFEDYIAKDLIAEIDGKYRTIRDRHARAIAGLSMGGYGALKFALKYPQSYAFAGSLSGALDAARDLDSRAPEFRARLVEVFGSPDNPARAENDIFLLLQKATAAQLPYLYLACATEDRFLPVNRDFVAELSERHLHYEYHETPGTHEWAYWDHAVGAMLSAMELKMGSESGRTRPATDSRSR